MNVETLRREYGKLTPFEREALIIKESVGKRREAEVDCLAARSMYEALWMTEWSKDFITVAAVALIHSLWADKLAWQALTCQTEAQAERADSLFEQGRLVSIGWLRALERLEQDTGAPLLDAVKMLGTSYAAIELERYEGKEVDCSIQYGALRNLWAVITKEVNTADSWRALPPLDRTGAQ